MVAIPEFHLVKGVSDYRSTVGFVDIMIRFKFNQSVWLCKNGERWTQVTGKYAREHAANVERSTSYRTLRLGVEVKINPVSVGDIVRQIALYAEYMPITEDKVAWLLATAFDLTQSDVDMLAAKSIKHIRLGEKFAAWCQQQEETAQIAVSPEF